MITETSSPQNDLSESICLSNRQQLPLRDLSIAPDDIGFRQGVTAVERLRTWGGTIWQLPEHLRRFELTCREIGFELDLSQWQSDIHLVLNENEPLISTADRGLTLLMTPGGTGGPATRIVYLSTIDHSAVNRRRCSGQPIEISDVQLPSPEAWPRHLKVRSRLHYFRADRWAEARRSGAVGVLIDQDGSVTETSVCSLAVVKQGEIFSPLPQRILPSVTQAVTERLAAEAGLNWYHRSIWPDEVRAADAVLLMGTDTGLWFANKIDGQPVTEWGDSIYEQLLASFDAAVRNGRSDPS